MHICEGCGRVLSDDDDEGLLLVELEDRYGVWHEWLCEACHLQAVEQVRDPHSELQNVTAYDFPLPHSAGPPSAA